MSVQVHVTIRLRRIGLGLTEDDVAQRCGLSLYEYGDLELRDQEFFEIARLADLRRVCSVLDLDLYKLLDLEAPNLEKGDPGQMREVLPRHVLVSRAMREHGISQVQLAELIGCDVATIERLESEHDFLEGWSVSLIRQLAGELKIAVDNLICCAS